MVFIKTLKQLRSYFLLGSISLLLLSFTACSWNDVNSSKPQTKQPSPRVVSTTRTPTRHSGKIPATHIVGSGEGFYTIARKYGLDYKKLAAWNNMSTNDVIFKGMKIKLYPPKNTSSSSLSNSTNGSSITTSSSNLNLQWPIRGRIINKFNANDNTIKGIDIAGQAGQRVKAAASGKVVYAGSGLVGLGNVIVIKHSESYLTAYGYNEKLLLSEGVVVKQGQDIAIIGIGLDNQRMLHFEVRKNGKPVNPIGYLPK